MIPFRLWYLCYRIYFGPLTLWCWLFHVPYHVEEVDDVSRFVFCELCGQGWGGRHDIPRWRRVIEWFRPSGWRY
jgi:hypothetical protein